ncbi:hypothetical protein MTO96_017943 [Rhipicephalus appendiculatus]
MPPSLQECSQQTPPTAQGILNGIYANECEDSPRYDSPKRKARGEDDIDVGLKDLLGSCSTPIQAIVKKKEKEAVQQDECDVAGSLVALKLRSLPKRKRSAVLF